MSEDIVKAYMKTRYKYYKRKDTSTDAIKVDPQDAVRYFVRHLNN